MTNTSLGIGLDDTTPWIEWPFDKCDSRKPPLAGQEMLSLAVLCHWIKMGRLANQSPALGPLFQATLSMFYDVALWLVLLAWPLVAFTSSFNVLYREPYGFSTDPDLCSGEFLDPDLDFQEWRSTLSELIEMLLDGTGNYECMRKSSKGMYAWLLMVIYMLFTLVMMMNLLIALMAKTFDNIYEYQELYYLFLSARSTSLWQRYPAVPPPFNLLGMPYALAKEVVIFSKKAAGFFRDPSNSSWFARAPVMSILEHSVRLKEGSASLRADLDAIDMSTVAFVFPVGWRPAGSIVGLTQVG